MLRELVRIARVLRHVTGKDVFRAALLDPLVLDAWPRLRVAAMGYLLAIRKKQGWGEHIDQVAAVIRKSQSVNQEMEILLQQNPALAECLKPLLKGSPVEQAARQQLVQRILERLRGQADSPWSGSGGCPPPKQIE